MAHLLVDWLRCCVPVFPSSATATRSICVVSTASSPAPPLRPPRRRLPSLPRRSVCFRSTSFTLVAVRCSAGAVAMPRSTRSTSNASDSSTTRATTPYEDACRHAWRSTSEEERRRLAAKHRAQERGKRAGSCQSLTTSLCFCVDVLLRPFPHSSSSSHACAQLPLSSGSLSSSRLLLVDAHSAIFVWSGRLVSSAAFDAYRRACLERAKDQSRYRLPATRIRTVTESDAADDAQDEAVDEEEDEARSLMRRLLPPASSSSSSSSHRRCHLNDAYVTPTDLSFDQYLDQIGYVQR